MIIKLPAAYDIAGAYQRVADWSKVSPKPLLVIHKATEGVYSQYNDATIHRDFPLLSVNGIRRGAYHFFRKSVSSITQAQLFCNYVRNILDPADIIALDMEEGGETPAQIIQWLDVVEENFPLNYIIIYSNPSKLDALYNSGTLAQRSRLSQYPAWVAAYPYAPDDFNTIPAVYMPKNFKTVMWQYSSQGRPQGIMNPSGVACNVDCNLLDPAFIEYLGGTVTPPPTGEPMSYKGTVKTTVRIRNADNTDAGGLLYAGDIVYGEIKLSYGLNRIFYNRIYRKAGTVQTWVGNSAVSDSVTTFIDTVAGVTDPAEVVTPPLPVPTGDTQINMTLKVDGTITGTWKEI